MRLSMRMGMRMRIERACVHAFIAVCVCERERV